MNNGFPERENSVSRESSDWEEEEKEKYNNKRREERRVPCWLACACVRVLVLALLFCRALALSRWLWAPKVSLPLPPTLNGHGPTAAILLLCEAAIVLCCAVLRCAVLYFLLRY
ncbi:hypothetical protein F5X98DRAFT_311806 [Xylaria grammica]|nr:hypothetical protein F5X98DRAFT_311806 [Xylaria grammica]